MAQCELQRSATATATTNLKSTLVQTVLLDKHGGTAHQEDSRATPSGPGMNGMSELSASFGPDLMESSTV
jgi:hypothetical protein